MLSPITTNPQRHARRFGQHVLHALARTRRALYIAGRANILTKLLPLFRRDEGFSLARKFLDGFGVESDIRLEADEKDGCAGAIAVDFSYPLRITALLEGDVQKRGRGMSKGLLVLGVSPWSLLSQCSH